MSDDPLAAFGAAPLEDVAGEELLVLLRQVLAEAGVDEATLDWAEERGALVLLALERLVVPGDRRLTRQELVSEVGMPLEEADRLWRSLGLAVVPDDEPHFTEADRDALAAVRDILSSGLSDPAMAFQMARVIGSSMARVAEAQIQALRTLRSRRGDLAAGAGGSVGVPELPPATATLLPRLEQFLVYAWRRHLQAAARRELHQEATETGRELAIGFADLVGFTALSRELPEDELVQVVDSFVGLAFGTAAEQGGRVVKTIGDEVMFVADDPAAALAVAFELLAATSTDDRIPRIRVGLGWGPVTAVDGDYYGPNVNLAHRLVALARPGTVLVSDDLHRSMEASGQADHQWSRLSPRRIKGVGEVTVWRARQVSG